MRVESVTSDDHALVAKFRGLSSTSENLVAFGDRFAYVSASCDGAPAAFAPGEPARVTCGGAGRHVLEVDFSRR